MPRGLLADEDGEVARVGRDSTDSVWNLGKWRTAVH